MTEGHPSQACGRKFHPLANIFPLLEGEDFDQLVASVKASSGPREPIVIHDGMILDGRNRARACEAAGVTPFFKPFEGDDPVAYVVDLNLKRRHLNDDQRRMVAAKLANMGRGRPSENPAECGIKVADAARMANVDEPGTERARTFSQRRRPRFRLRSSAASFRFQPPHKPPSLNQKSNLKSPPKRKRGALMWCARSSSKRLGLGANAN